MNDKNKQKYTIWLKPDTIRRVDGWMAEDNCKSRSEFTEKAIRFYMGYLGSEDNTAYLSKTLLSSLTGALRDMENRICRLLFKLSVEESMLAHVVASGMSYDENELRNLRGTCVEDVKRTGGSISLEDAVRFQKGIG
jgi:hypothetical protein